MHDLTIERVEELIENCKGKEIAVIGDVMLDRYFWGNVSRISPEAPVPVVDVEEESYHLGGAANVASNLNSLGITPVLFGVIGNDYNGRLFKNIAEEDGIKTDGLWVDEKRPTTVKTRIIGNNQQLIRLDREVRDNISDEFSEWIINEVINKLENLSGVIFEDYNKGTISKSLINKVIKYCKDRNIPVFVDPKFDYFFDYQGVTVFKPNMKEASQAINKELKDKESVVMAGKELLERLNCENVLLTLGKEGMMLFERDGKLSSVPTRARKVADVSGAGDTAIATLAALYASGANIREAATIANYAAGTVCEQPGIVSITPAELVSTIKKNNVKK